MNLTMIRTFKLHKKKKLLKPVPWKRKTVLNEVEESVIMTMMNTSWNMTCQI